MEFVYFTAVAIALYILADRILLWIESTLGRTLEQRSVVFFMLLLGMALVSFWLIRMLTAQG